jgi:phosphomannomutase/phosphoglucomutase
MINSQIFRAYDIRGIYGQDLTAEGAELIGKGFGTYLGGGKKIVVGRDNRIHGEELQKAFIRGLVGTGCLVFDLGLSPSPYLYFANTYGQFEAGCNVTASHNSAEYNGFKLVGGQAHSICGQELQKILKIIQNKEFIVGVGSVIQVDFTREYKTKLQTMFSFSRKIRVVVDTGNGVAGQFYPSLINQLGVDVIGLYTELDGNFPHHSPDPIVEGNLIDLKQKVLENKADLGIAFDGDGDRVAFIDEKGNFHNSDQTLFLLSRDLLSRQVGSKVVFTVSNSQALFSDIEAHGGIPIMTKVGHSFVENTMAKEQALLGGEQSGHFFIKENYYAYDDALVAALKVIQILNNGIKPISELFAELPPTFSEPEMRPYVNDDIKFKVIEKITRFFTPKYKCNTLDGVRIDFGEDAWAGLRASNTSPCLSICLEAKSKEKLIMIKNEIMAHLKEYPDINWLK